MRYLGGLLGGTWLTAMAGDLGAGKFDGANLVANFESMHPDNTWWTKPYNVYANVDTEAERFLDFETWWGSPVVLNAQEMQWIADNLFVGNKLTAGQISSRDGVRIDLRNVNSPVVVFCSWGDDITPPPQALDWITDLYTDENEIKAAGKTIVYALHQTVGHLGIFVSGKVADKEHAEFASCMSMIEVMPAGLYEAVIDKPEAETANPALIEGGYLFRLEPRTLDHIRALGQTSPEDQRRFATAARVSETNKTLYDAFAAPFVRSLANPASAAVLRRMHPNRLRFAAFSDWNPWMNAVGPMAETIRQNRRPVAKDNPLLALEEAMSSAVTSGLKAYGNLRDAAAEATFLRTYGSPMLQAMAGVTADASAPGPRSPGEPAPQTDPAHFEDRLERGGPFEACVRALLFVRGPEGGADERAFNMIRDLRAARPESQRLTKAQIKQTLQEQTALLSWDGVRAINAVAHMLPADAGDRHRLMETLRAVLTASGGLSAEAGKRLNRVEALFGAADHPHGAVRHA
jgi:hypothetical protein